MQEPDRVDKFRVRPAEVGGPVETIDFQTRAGFPLHIRIIGARPPGLKRETALTPRRSAAEPQPKERRHFSARISGRASRRQKCRRSKHPRNLRGSGRFGCIAVQACSQTGAGNKRRSASAVWAGLLCVLRVSAFQKNLRTHSSADLKRRDTKNAEKRLPHPLGAQGCFGHYDQHVGSCFSVAEQNKEK